MTDNRRKTVYLLSAIAFFVLFLFPLLSLKTTVVSADATESSAAVHNGDYVFFVVQNEEVPLAAAPTSNDAAFIIWVGLASFAAVIIFIYSAWYMSVKSNIRELTERLLPNERKMFYSKQSFFHPIRSYRLSKEAEDTVASLYFSYR